MKCPNCGLDNPPSITVCPCGYDLGTGQADLQKSLKEQVQLIQEEARRSRDAQRKEDSKTEVDSDLKEDFEKVPKPNSTPVTKEQEKSSLFRSFCLELYSMLSQPWPRIVDLKTAGEASKQGVWAAGVITVIGSVQALSQFSSGDTPMALASTVTAVWFVFAAWGIHRKSRVVAVCALSSYLLEVAMNITERGLVGSGIIWILFVIAFANSVRGTFAYHKDRDKPRSEIDPETGLPSHAKTSVFVKVVIVLSSLLGVVVVVGVVFMILSMARMGEGVVLTGQQMKASHAEVVRSLEILEPEEEIRYFFTDAMWDIKDGFYLLTNKNVVLFSQQWAQPMIQISFDQIARLEVYYSDSWLEYSTVVLDLVNTSDASFPLGPDNGGDHNFVEALEEATGLEANLLEEGLYTAFGELDEGLSYNEEAVEELTAGNYDEAERLFDLALEKMTKDDQEETRIIHENLGLLYLNKGDDGQALKHYQEALSLSDFNGPEYYHNTGEINLLEGNVTEAIEDFERVLEIEPDHFGANNNLGWIFLGTIDEEIVDYESALPHNQKAVSLSENAITIQNLATNYYFLDRYSDALPLFEILNSYSPDNAVAKYYIGLIYWENGDLTRATIFLKEAIQLDPSLYSEEIGEILGIPSGEQPSGGVI